MPIEITTPTDDRGHSFLSEVVKKADSEKVLPVLGSELRTAINNLAAGVFDVLGARDYRRIDMRLDASGNPNFIEANLMPGLSNHGYLSRCFYLNRRMIYEDMILSIVALGIDRLEEEQLPVISHEHNEDLFTRTLSV